MIYSSMLHKLMLLWMDARTCKSNAGFRKGSVIARPNQCKCRNSAENLHGRMCPIARLTAWLILTAPSTKQHTVLTCKAPLAESRVPNYHRQHYSVNMPCIRRASCGFADPGIVSIVWNLAL